MLERADADRDGHRRLKPLTAAGVAEVATAYAGDELDGVPLDAIVRSSGGMPAAVHRALLEWGRNEAARRLAAAGEWLAEGGARRAGGLAFANNVIRIRLERLFDVPEAEEPSGDCPYKGLAPFGEADAGAFFGRERLVGELAARTVGFGLLAIIGTSGSGKSSVVQAGLLPSLASGLLPGSERWTHAVFRPGARPLAALEPALAFVGAGERRVLVVDQFEETFTLCPDEVERSAFVARLVELAADSERNALVVTVRDDFYGACAAYPELAALIAANQVLVPPMTREELRRASELPARRAGVRLEPALLDALVEEASDQAGTLPLLSTALVELWQTREAGWIGFAAYERTGGISGAVARLAEESFARLDGPEREAARALLLRLAGGEDAEAITRRRVPFAELDLDSNPHVAAVLARFTDDRLLTASEQTVEVAHEALLREWPRLRAWLDDDAEGRRLRVQVTQAAVEWEAGGRDASELFTGARLTATLDWTQTHGRELNDLEREFVAASREAAEHEARRQRRINRRLRGLLAVAVVLLAAAAVAGGVALVQRGRARRSATAAEAQRLGAQALTVTPPDQSFLYARESYNLEPSPATRGYLFAAQERSPAALAVVHPVTGRIHVLASSPGRSRQLVLSNADQVAVVDARTLATEHTFTIGPGALAWAGDDAVLSTNPVTHRLGFFDLKSGRFTPDPRLPASAYSVSNDGRLLYTLPTSGASIGVVNLKTMRTLRRILPTKGFVFDDVEPEQGGVVVAVESSPGNRAASTRYQIWLHGLAGAPGRTILGGPGIPPFVPYAVGGHRFAVTLARGVKVVDLRTGRVWVDGSDVGAVTALALSPDGGDPCPRDTRPFGDQRRAGGRQHPRDDLYRSSEPGTRRQLQPRRNARLLGRSGWPPDRLGSHRGTQPCDDTAAVGPGPASEHGAASRPPVRRVRARTPRRGRPRRRHRPPRVCNRPNAADPADGPRRRAGQAGTAGLRRPQSHGLKARDWDRRRPPARLRHRKRPPARLAHGSGNRGPSGDGRFRRVRRERDARGGHGQWPRRPLPGRGPSGAPSAPRDWPGDVARLFP